MRFPGGTWRVTIALTNKLKKHGGGSRIQDPVPGFAGVGTKSIIITTTCSKYTKTKGYEVSYNEPLLFEKYN